MLAKLIINEGFNYVFIDVQTLKVCDNGGLAPQSPFNNIKNLRAIDLPDDIETIPSHFFNGCHQLERITGGKNIKNCSSHSFVGCFALKEVDFPVRIHYGNGKIRPLNFEDDFKGVDFWSITGQSGEGIVMHKQPDGLLIWDITKKRYVYSLCPESADLFDSVSYKYVLPKLEIKEKYNSKTGRIHTLLNWTFSDEVNIDSHKRTCYFNPYDLLYFYKCNKKYVDSLDIKSIVESYKPSTNSYVVRHNRAEVDYIDEYAIESSVTDNYICSILPPYFGQDLRKEHWERVLSNVPNIKSKALASYSKEDHLMVLMSDVIQKYVDKWDSIALKRFPYLNNCLFDDFFEEFNSEALILRDMPDGMPVDLFNIEREFVKCGLGYKQWMQSENIAPTSNLVGCNDTSGIDANMDVHFLESSKLFRFFNNKPRKTIDIKNTVESLNRGIENDNRLSESKMNSI